jgi:hypothetical protein
MVNRWLFRSRALRVAMALSAAIGVIATGGHAMARSSHRLTHQPGFIDYWPRFSPDGKTVLFSRCEISTGCRDDAFGHVTLWTVPAAGGKARKFLDLDGVSTPDPTGCGTPR